MEEKGKTSIPVMFALLRPARAPCKTVTSFSLSLQARPQITAWRLLTNYGRLACSLGLFLTSLYNLNHPISINLHPATWFMTAASSPACLVSSR